LIAQWGNDSSLSSGYDLSPNGVTEYPLANGAEFPAISADGSLMLAPDATLYPLPDNTTALPATGLTAVSTSIGTPAFSPDTQRVVFNMLLSGTISAPKQKLVVMNYDPVTYIFSNPVVVADYSALPLDTRPGWPAFFPDGQSVVFHAVDAGVDGNNLGDLRSRKAPGRDHRTSASDASAVTPLTA
jgi:Tol biopolymer transport system component